MEEKIIEHVRRNPCLYDRNSKEYKNTKMRTAKLEEISTKLRIPVQRVKERWRTLRDTYLKEKRRLATIKDPDSVRKWKWMDKMEFLDEPQCAKWVTPDNSEHSSWGNDNTKFSWHVEDESQIVDIDAEYVDQKDHNLVMSDSDEGSLLVPMGKESFEKPLNNISKIEGNLEMLPMGSDIARRSSFLTATGKSSIHMFCETLATQIEEANLTRYQLSLLQIELLKKLHEFLPKDE